jgi:hypothetical protein
MKRRLAGMAFVIAAAATAVGLSASTALADVVITRTYALTGSTFVAGTDSTVTLGPGTLTASLDLNTLDITAGTLTLPTATSTFTVLGVPTTVTVAFIQQGQITGSVSGVATDGTVTTTADVTLQITSLSEAGINIPVGPNCETVTPAQITTTSPAGVSAAGGNFTVSGTYTIPLFNNCGLLDVLAPVIDAIIPGPGNTISLSLGPATAD